MMGKRKLRKARLTAKGRVAAFGQIFEWLYQHHRTVQASCLDRSPFLWDGIASEMLADGVVSISGAPPNRVSANRAWRHVTRYLAQEAEDRKARLAARGHVSRRTTGWVPPSSAPAQPPPVPAGPRRDTTPHPHVAAAAPAAPASPAAPPRTAAAPPSGPAGPHILSTVTPEEAEYLAPFSDRSENMRVQLLKNHRAMAHMDRFNKPFRK